MRDPFGLRLQERVRALGPLCVGVDPSSLLLSAWDRSDSVEGLEFASLAILEAVLGVAAAIKPQIAFFERFGSNGMRVLERLIGDARDADILVVADAKRGDFAPTNVGYAEAWLGERSPLCVDAVTVSPYLGVMALRPFFDRAEENGRGVFVLAATSNDEGRVLQSARTADDERVEEMVLRQVSELNRRRRPRERRRGARRDARSSGVQPLVPRRAVPGAGRGRPGGDRRQRLENVRALPSGHRARQRRTGDPRCRPRPRWTA
jgi:orotidine-5'-phosphate decarboxylase